MTELAELAVWSTWKFAVVCVVMSLAEQIHPVVAVGIATTQVEPLAVPMVTTKASVPFGALMLGEPPPQPEEIVGAVAESARLANTVYVSQHPTI